MNSTQGYIKIWRELMSKPIWQTSSPAHKVILVTLLCMANFRPNEWQWNGEKYTCQPGQFITSLENIRAECGKGVTNQNVRTALVKFEKYDFLTKKSTKNGTLITITNWAMYQSNEDEATHKVTKSQQTPNKQVTHRLTTIEEGKNVKNDKKIYTLSKQIQDLYLLHCPNLPKVVKLTDKRQKATKKLLEQLDQETIVAGFKAINDSAFCTGQNDRGWKADFDFCIRPDSIVKAVEGKYAGSKSKAKSVEGREQDDIKIDF